MASNPILKLVLLRAIISDLCIECGTSVSGRKHAVMCDACEQWQHRLCNTGEDQDQDQDQDSLLVKRRNDNHSPGPVIRELVPSSHQRSELSNTILCIFSG